MMDGEAFSVLDVDSSYRLRHGIGSNWPSIRIDHDFCCISLTLCSVGSGTECHIQAAMTID